MSGIKIPISAAFDKGNVDQVLQDFQRQLNALGQQIAKANKVKFNPVDRTTLDDLRKVNASFENLRRVSSDLNRRMKATGQQGAGFLDLDWARMYPDEHSRARQMHKAFSYVVGDQFAGAPPAGGGGGGGGGRAWSGAGRQVVGAGLSAAGPVGGVVNNAINAGMSGGAAAGLAGLVGGMAALALGKAIGAVMEKVGKAQEEAIGYDTLKRTLGDVNVSFNVLKESLRNSARTFDATFEESQKLGMQFAKLSGMTAEQYKTLAEEVSLGGGFGRSYGLDPSTSNAFFAQMRQFRVTGNSRESRELALMIGESVAKSGSSAKMDEVLEAIANFTSQQTRMGLTAANVSGYGEALTGLIASGRAGLDPAGAAALLGKVNSSIASGGSYGEAGQNFLYSAIGSRLGLNPIQTKILQEQGAFGTGRMAFGDGSLYQQYSGRGIGAGSSDVTNLQMIKDRLDRMYGPGQDDLKADAMANLFGLNITQAMAMSSINPTLLGGLSARLKRNGVNINDVNATGIQRISEIEADKSLSEGEKDRLIKDAATQNQEKTQGSEIREGLAGVERATVSMADKLLDPLIAIRAGIMYLAGEGGKLSPRQIQEAVLKSENKDKLDQINGKYNKLLEAQQERIDKARGKAETSYSALAWQYRGDDAGLQRALAERDAAKKEQKAAILEMTRIENERTQKIKEQNEELQKNVDMLNNGPAGAGAGRGFINPGMPGGSNSGRTFGSISSASSQFDDLFRKYEEAYGLPRGVLKATALKENRQMNPNAIGATNANGSVDMGLMQHNSRFLAERGLTNTWSDPERSVEEAAKLWRKNLNAAGGNIRTGARMYNGSGPAAEAYADDFMSVYGGVAGTPLPSAPTGAGGAGGAQEVRVKGEVTVNLPGGQSVTAPLEPSGRVRTPTPQGAR